MNRFGSCCGILGGLYNHPCGKYCELFGVLSLGIPVIAQLFEESTFPSDGRATAVKRYQNVFTV